jgi:hypothetical protein
MAFLKGHWQLLLLTTLVVALWPTPVLFPLKLLVVFLHELSHGLAAVLTGGRIVEMDLSVLQGGHAITQGGSQFVILMAGYLGSLAFGVALFLTALRGAADRAVLAALGLVVLAVTLLYMRSLFALAFGVATGAAMLAGARWLPRAGCDLALRVIGLSSMIYVPLDIFSDTIARSHLQSDARMMAERFGGPTLFWGGLWLAVSIAVIWQVLRRGLGADSNLMPLGRRQGMR